MQAFQSLSSAKEFEVLDVSWQGHVLRVFLVLSLYAFFVPLTLANPPVRELLRDSLAVRDSGAEELLVVFGWLPLSSMVGLNLSLAWLKSRRRQEGTRRRSVRG